MYPKTTTYSHQQINVLVGAQCKPVTISQELTLVPPVMSENIIRGRCQMRRRGPNIDTGVKRAEELCEGLRAAKAWETRTPNGTTKGKRFPN